MHNPHIQLMCCEIPTGVSSETKCRDKTRFKLDPNPSRSVKLLVQVVRVLKEAATGLRVVETAGGTSEYLTRC